MTTSRAEILFTAALKKLDEQCKKEAACIKRYGMTRKDLKEIKDMGVVHAFTRHKISAKTRGIEFRLSLLEWWSIWRDSGKWSERGRGASAYCMARTGDVGPYEIGNVYITTGAINCSDGQRTKTEKRKNKNGSTRTAAVGSGRGWTLIERCKSKPYCVQIYREKQRFFATQQEAESFYKSRTEDIKRALLVVG